MYMDVLSSFKMAVIDFGELPRIFSMRQCRNPAAKKGSGWINQGESLKMDCQRFPEKELI